MSVRESIRVFAPATVANVACGFDILGFAVEAPGDEVVLRRTKQPGIRITRITGDGGRLSTDPATNTVSVPVMGFWERIRPEGGIEIELHKKMPFGSGLGSSAASAAASIFAVNELFGSPLSKDELLPYAMKGEEVACGSAHADNVAPSLFGGFVLIRSYHPLDVVRIQTPPGLACAIVHPHIEVPTKDARSILKKDIPMKDAIVQWGNVAGLIAGMLQQDYDLIGRSLEDVIVEPVRSLLIPGFDQAKAASLAAGALGCGISGSGPSVFSLACSMEVARAAGLAKQEAFARVGIDSELFVSGINRQGPVVLD